jgi:hypothetical protein
MLCSLVGNYQYLEKPTASILRVEDEGSRFLQNVGPIHQLHSITSQKTIISVFSHQTLKSHKILFFYYWWDGSKYLGSAQVPRYCGHFWPIVQTPDDR